MTPLRATLNDDQKAGLKRTAGGHGKGQKRPGHAHRLVLDWYRERAHEIFGASVTAGFPHFDHIYELCHLVEHNHGKGFYDLLSRVMPSWQERKETLEGYDFG